MINGIILLIKGIFVGLGKIIPGVSGALIAISLNVYDKSIEAINTIFKKPKQSLKLLIPVGLGVIIGIILFSKLVIYSLDNYYLCTMLLFIGLIMGGLPSIMKRCKKEYKKINNIIALIVIILLIISFMIYPANIKMYENNFFTIFILGMIDAFSMVIPGISGTAIFMMLNKYDFIMETFSNLSNITLLLTNIKIIFPFVLGLIVGVLMLVKLIAYLFKNHETKTYYFISLFSIFSVVSLFIKTFQHNYNLTEILIGLILLVIGYLISKKIDEIS